MRLAIYNLITVFIPASVQAKKINFKDIIELIDGDGLEEKLLNNGKLLTKIDKVKAKIDTLTSKYAPEMKGKNIKDVVQHFMGKKFLMKVIEDKFIVKMNGKLYDYDIRIDVFEDENGKIRQEIRPIVEAKNPPNTRPIQEKEINIDVPNWSGNATMVLTNTAVLQRKHPRNFTKIMKMLKGFGPVIDVAASQGVTNWQAIDKLVERKFDRKKYNSLFIFGSPDVIPFGTFNNPVKKIRPMDLDRIIYSDDHYGDFNHDKYNDWEIMVTRLPDDNGILQNPQSILYRSVPANNKPKYKKFTVYGNQNWKVADRIARIGGGGILMSEPVNENSFNSSHFRGKNIVLTLHGTRLDGSRYWGEIRKKPGQYQGKTLPSMNLSHAVAPDSVIVSGCCYGAYIDGTNNNSDNRLALRFLRNGARAYIGNTGIGWIGGTTERTTGLWAKLYMKYISQGNSPQRAFFLAKKAYATEARDPYNFKMLHQYIYLGLPPVGKSIGKTNPNSKPEKKNSLLEARKKSLQNKEDIAILSSSQVTNSTGDKLIENFIDSIKSGDIDQYMSNFSMSGKMMTASGKVRSYQFIKLSKKVFFNRNKNIKVQWQTFNSKFAGNTGYIDYKMTLKGRKYKGRVNTTIENGRLTLIKQSGIWKISEIKIK